MLRISRRDKVKNTEVLRKPLQQSLSRWKMAYAGHVLKGSGGVRCVNVAMHNRLNGVKIRGIVL